MIIDSLLDTDLYKFTMMQVLLHHFPGAQVEYVFKCRTEGVDLAPHLDDIRAGIADLCKLRFGDDELAYLRSLRFMKSDFVDFLGLFQFNQKYIRIERTPGAAPGMQISVRGPRVPASRASVTDRRPHRSDGRIRGRPHRRRWACPFRGRAR